MNLRKYIQISDSKAVVPFEEKDDAELYMNQLAERWFEGMFFLKGYPRPKSPKKAEVALMFERNLKSLIQNYLFPEIKDPKHLKLEQLQKIDEAKAWILANARELISQRSFISFSLNPNEFFTLSVAENLGSRQFTKTVPNENFTLSTSQKFLYLQETDEEVKSSEWKKQDELYTFTETFDLDATLINVPPYSNGKLNPELLTKLYWCQAIGIDYVVNTNRILQKSLEKMLTALVHNHNVEEETLDYSLKCLKDHGLNPRVCTPGDPHTNSDLKYYEVICRNERFVLEKLNQFDSRDQKLAWLQTILHPKVDSEFNAEEKELIEVLTKEKEWKAKPGEGWKQPQALLISNIIAAERKSLGTITAHFDDDYKNIDGMHTDLLLAPQFIPALVVRKKDEGLNIDGFEQVSRLDGLSQFANEDFILRFIENNQKELKHPSADKNKQLKELAAIQYFIQMNPAHHLLPNLLKAFYKNKYKHLNKDQQESFNEFVAVKVLNLFECESRQQFLNKRNIDSAICKRVAKKIALMKPSKTLHSSFSGSNLKPQPKIHIQRSASVRDIRHKPEIKISSRARVSTNSLFSQLSPSSKALTDLLRPPSVNKFKHIKREEYGRAFQGAELGDELKKLLDNKSLKPTLELKIDVMSNEDTQIKTSIGKFNSFEDLQKGLPIVFENSIEWVNTLAQIYQTASNFLIDHVTEPPSPELSMYFTENGINLLEHALSMHPQERLQAAMLTSILEIVGEHLVNFPKCYAEILMKVIQRQNILIMNCRDALDNLLREEISKDPKIVRGLKELYAPTVIEHVQHAYDEINKYFISLLKNPKKFKEIPSLTLIISKIKEHAMKGDIEFLKKIDINTIATQCRLESLGVVLQEKNSNESKLESKEPEALSSQQLKTILNSNPLTSSISQRVQPKFNKPAMAATASTVVGGTGVTYTFLTAGALVAAQQVIPVWGQIVAAVFLAVGVSSLITMGVLKFLSWNSERRRKNSEKVVQQTLPGHKDEVTPTQINQNSLTRNATMSQKLGIEKAPDARPQPVPAFSPNPVVAQADPSRVAGLEEGYSAQTFSNETQRQIRL